MNKKNNRNHNVKEKESNDKSGKRKRSSQKAKRAAALILAAVIVLISAFVIVVNAYDKIPINTYAAGINIGGLKIDDAEKAIQDGIADKLSGKSVKIMYNGESRSISVDELEPSVNARQTAEQTAEKRLGTNIFSKMVNILSSGFKRSDNPLDISLNDEILLSSIDEFTEKFETPAKECSFELEGNTLKIFKGEDGKEFNHDKIKEDIYNSISLLEFNDIDLRIESVKPREVPLDEIYERITAPAVDAYYEKTDGKVTVNPGIPHIEIDKESVKAALDSKEKTTEIKVTTTPPNITKDYLQSKIFVDKMGSFTSKFSTSNVERASNVRLAASKINNYILLPGEIFSYDTTVGPRTKANGFRDAPVYVGNKVESGVGGGICQTSSTLYSAVLYSNLEIVERTSHSLPVSYMPDGQDATIAEGYIDFKFRNNTKYPVKISAYTNGGSITCDIYGVKEPGIEVRLTHSKTATLPSSVTKEADSTVPVGYKKISQKGADGYKIASTRIVSINGVEQKREALTPSVYNSKPTIILVNPHDMGASVDSLTAYSGKAPEPTENPEQSGSTAASDNSSSAQNQPQSETAPDTNTQTGSADAASENGSSV